MGNLGAQTSSFQAYVKPSADKDGLSATKKQTKAPKEETILGVWKVGAKWRMQNQETILGEPPLCPKRRKLEK
ncbi:activating signal cointegrator 1 [Iris pallida]|uniref:Activating signal cointegrator 1 n=1 Tax=Iris pallida TaxID=29817 RepID=A0AAX6FEL2_IRIPA|nr:activating signal cointegrator 1 [Iris pallida]